MDLTTAFSEQIRQLMAIRLREEFPYLKQETLEGVSDQCKQTIAECLLRELPRMEASRNGVNLLTIPPEIRNRIFMLVLIIGEEASSTEGPDGKALIEFADYEQPLEVSSSGSKYDYYAGDEERIIQPPLTQVCKQLRAETLGIYYRANTFLIHAWDYGYGYEGANQDRLRLYSEGVKDWLTSIGSENRDLIKAVLVLNHPDNMTKVTGERFAAALSAAGVGLSNCVFTSLRSDTSGLVKITAEDDNVKAEATVNWVLSSCTRFHTS